MADVRPLSALLNVGVRPVRDGVALVTVAGEVDMLTVSSLDRALTPPAADPAVRVLVCDLSGVSFFACSGVTALLGAREAVVGRGASLRLVAHAHAVLRPLAVTGLLALLPVSADLPSAFRQPF